MIPRRLKDVALKFIRNDVILYLTHVDKFPWKFVMNCKCIFNKYSVECN